MPYEPKGTRFFDAATNRQMLFVQDKDHSFDGWLCYRHPDGQWVTLRKATDDDIARIKAAQPNDLG